MSNNRLTINCIDEKIQLIWQRGQEIPRCTSETPFKHPFTEKILQDIRWYLEEYLKFPYGIYPDKAKNIEQDLKTWGLTLFELVFKGTPNGYDYFQEATRTGLDDCEICITSENPQILNLPWELLYSDNDLFLAPKLAGFYRSLSSQRIRGEMQNSSQDKLNILLVIARPYRQDIEFQTIAQPILEALEPLKSHINLKLLRPPSFSAFEKELSAHPQGFYHIVHFDGHGSFKSNSQGRQLSFVGSSEQGKLIFETLEGKAEEVNADQIAQSLSGCKVPIFVLNACKSAQEGEEIFTSVASRLIFCGAKGVVAMAYNIYVDAAKHFIGRFYEEILLGHSLSKAVNSARLELLNNPHRQTARGHLPINDWFVPILYQQEPCIPFVAKSPSGDFTTLLNQKEHSLETVQTDLQPIDLPSTNAYGFIGRSLDILKLERAFRKNNIVLVRGIAGVGKTQLSLGFSDWLLKTQGRVGGIFFQSFENNETLDVVINRVGHLLGGERFSTLNPDEQESIVLEYLLKNSCLLIWDNFETVEDFLNETIPSNRNFKKDRFKSWINFLKEGKSWILITSRKREDWLDCGYYLVDLKGLSIPSQTLTGLSDSEILAAKILQTAGVELSNISPKYLELLNFLKGHPLSLRVILPNLCSETPENLIKNLKEGVNQSIDAEDNKEKSLIASLDYSYNKLSNLASIHLPFLSFFCSRTNVLCIIDSSQEISNQLYVKYQNLFGKYISVEDWLNVLSEAEKAGLLCLYEQGVAQILPVIGGYLKQKLYKRMNSITQESKTLDTLNSNKLENTPIQITDLEVQLVYYYAGLANHFGNIFQTNISLGMNVILFEEPNLLHYFEIAIYRELWAEVYEILRSLGLVYERQGREAEADRLFSYIQNTSEKSLEDHKDKNSDAFKIWAHCKMHSITKLLERTKNLEEAKHKYLTFKSQISQRDDKESDYYLAAVYHQLGIIETEEKNFCEAKDFYNKSIHIYEQYKDTYNTAREYHQLGLIEQSEGRLDEAVILFKKACDIKEDVGDTYLSANSYNQLGLIAEAKQDHEQSIKYFQKCVEIFEYFKNPRRYAIALFQLGRIYRKISNYKEAINIQLKALEILEEQEGTDFDLEVLNELGENYFRDGDFSSAFAYYRKCAIQYEDKNLRHKLFSSLERLGLLYNLNQDYEKAKLCYEECEKILQQSDKKSNIPAVKHQLGVIADMQGDSSKAVDLFNEALTIYELEQDINGISIEHNSLGYIAQCQEDYRKAIDHYVKAIVAIHHESEQNKMFSFLIRNLKQFCIKFEEQKILDYIKQAVHPSYIDTVFPKIVDSMNRISTNQLN